MNLGNQFVISLHHEIFSLFFINILMMNLHRPIMRRILRHLSTTIPLTHQFNFIHWNYVHYCHQSVNDSVSSAIGIPSFYCLISSFHHFTVYKDTENSLSAQEGAIV